MHSCNKTFGRDRILTFYEIILNTLTSSSDKSLTITYTSTEVWRLCTARPPLITSVLTRVDWSTCTCFVVVWGDSRDSTDFSGDRQDGVVVSDRPIFCPSPALDMSPVPHRCTIPPTIFSLGWEGVGTGSVKRFLLGRQEFFPALMQDDRLNVREVIYPPHGAVSTSNPGDCGQIRGLFVNFQNSPMMNDDSQEPVQMWGIKLFTHWFPNEHCQSNDLTHAP